MSKLFKLPAPVSPASLSTFSSVLSAPLRFLSNSSAQPAPRSASYKGSRRTAIPIDTLQCRKGTLYALQFTVQSGRAALALLILSTSIIPVRFQQPEPLAWYPVSSGHDCFRDDDLACAWFSGGLVDRIQLVRFYGSYSPSMLEASCGNRAVMPCSGIANTSLLSSPPALQRPVEAQSTKMPEILSNNGHLVVS